MATYLEIFDLKSNASLRNRVAIAIAVAADTIRAEDPATANHAARMAWASRALQNTDAEAPRVLLAVLAQNKALTVAQINSATDSGLQTGVDNAVNLLATV